MDWWIGDGRDSRIDGCIVNFDDWKRMLCDLYGVFVHNFA